MILSKLDQNHKDGIRRLDAANKTDESNLVKLTERQILASLVLAEMQHDAEYLGNFFGVAVTRCDATPVAMATSARTHFSLVTAV